MTKDQLDERLWTLQDVLEALQSLSQDELRQKAQVGLANIDSDSTVPLHPILGVATAKDWEIKTRDIVDGKHYPDQIVILAHQSDWH